MLINLSDIPEEGKTFQFTRQTGELNKVLQDILGSSEYLIEFIIRPLDTHYEVQGTAQVHWFDVCSKCGTEMNMKTERKIREILTEELELDRITSLVFASVFGCVWF